MKQVYLCLGILCLGISIFFFMQHKPEPSTVAYSPPPSPTPYQPPPTPEPTPVPSINVNKVNDYFYEVDLSKGYWFDTGIDISDNVKIYRPPDNRSCVFMMKLQAIEVWDENAERTIESHSGVGITAHVIYWYKEPFSPPKALYRIYLGTDSAGCADTVRLNVTMWRRV